MYKDLTTRYAVLKLYNIEVQKEQWLTVVGILLKLLFIILWRQVSDEEQQLLEETWKRWQALWLHEVKVVNKRMEPIKGRFTKITIQERDRFRAEVLAFVKRYYDSGMTLLMNNVYLEFGIHFEKYEIK